MGERRTMRIHTLALAGAVALACAQTGPDEGSTETEGGGGEAEGAEAGSGSGGTGGGEDSSAETSAGTSTSTGSGTSTSTGSGTSASTGSGTSASTGSGSSSETGSGSETGGEESGGDTDGGPAPSDLPEPSGPCPELVDGDVTFAPAGIAARDVRVWISDAAETADGPLVFYWHGTGSSPMEAPYGLGAQTVGAIVDAGGIVVAPYHDPAAGTWPWYLVSGNQQDDLILADEVLACAIAGVGVDTRRIHTLGMSAGGIQATQMSFRRSNYLASVVIYSGGVGYGSPPNVDPSNLFGAMIFHGGDDDVVQNFSFPMASENYRNLLVADGHYALMCNHGLGHMIPTDAAPAVAQFFTDHPWGTDPSPWAGGLPAVVPSYCAP